MIRHFFIDKTNSIITHSEQNMGLNPISYVSYGAYSMKSIIHFDISQIKELIEDKTFCNRDKLTFTLKMTNCFSVDEFPQNKELIGNLGAKTVRTSSFDLMLYKLPRHFDAGRGFDYISDLWEHNNKSFIKEGSNWYCCSTGILWDGSIKPNNLKEVNGDIYSNEFIKEEYEKYLKGNESIIIGTQHFDYGYENLSIDITSYIYDVLSEKINDINYGLCLSFIPRYNDIKSDDVHYVGFFNDNTNTFFHPYVEAKYSEYINDDRESYIIGSKNKLYLYVSDNGKMTNLDTLPSCNINNKTYEVKQATKGVYYAITDTLNNDVYEDTISYDTWSNIVLNGEKIDDVEMEFYVNPKSKKLLIGSNSNTRNNLVPSIYGINDDESINIGDVREITVDFRKKFETNKIELIDNAEFRLYIKDGDREIDVFEYQPIEKGFLNNFFVLHTGDLIPNKYFIDIKVKIGREIKYYKEILRFKIISNVTNRYQ